VSDILRVSVAIYTQDVGTDGVMIPLTPHYRDQLVKRLREYPGQKPREVLERFLQLQLALDGAWIQSRKIFTVS